MTNPRRTRRSPRSSSRPWIVASAFAAAAGALVPGVAAQPNAPRASALNGRTVDEPGRTLPDLAALGLALPEAPGPVRTYAIAEGPLADVLATLGREAGVAIEVRNETITGLTSPGVKGTFTLQQALTAALEGTGLTSRITSPTTVVVELRIDSESVEVAAGLPRVASPRYPTSVTETPQTLQVIPRAVIDEQGAFSLGDVLRNVPGITLQAGEGGGASNTAGESFNMRGFNANNSMFVDGVRDDGLITRDTFNLEQVEVFLGPTGTDVGRGTGAGYVNMVTKAPRPSSSYGGGLTYGTNSQARATVDLNVGLPLGADGSWLSRSAVRFNALFQDGGVPGRDEVTNERQRRRAVARARPRLGDARQRQRPVRASGQRARLRTAGRRVSRRPVDPRRRHRVGRGRSGQLLRHPRQRFRRCRAGQLPRQDRARRVAAADDPQPGPLQPHASSRRHQHGHQCRGIRSGHGDGHDFAPGQRAQERDLLQPGECVTARCCAAVSRTI